MFQKLSKKLRKKQGFTLIELIVVLAILGIILAIAVPNYLGVQDRAATRADNSQLDLVEKAVKLWYNDDELGDEGVYEIVNGTAALVVVSGGTADDISDYMEIVSTPASAANDELHIYVEVTATEVEAQYASSNPF